MTSKIYSAGWNRPGFLPESDPIRTTNFETAKQYIIDCILEYADDEALGPLSDAIANVAEDVNLCAEHDGHLEVSAGAFVYFVQETEPEDDEEARKLALISHLDDDGTDLDDVDESSHTSNAFEACGNEYLVLTDDEATEAANEQIEELLWAFNADFIADYMPDGITAEHVEKLRGDSCEDINEAFLALVGDNLDKLKADAISADGRGHFLAGYDHEENENDDATLFIYRTN